MDWLKRKKQDWYRNSDIRDAKLDGLYGEELRVVEEGGREGWYKWDQEQRRKREREERERERHTKDRKELKLYNNAYRQGRQNGQRGMQTAYDYGWMDREGYEAQRIDQRRREQARAQAQARNHHHNNGHGAPSRGHGSHRRPPSPKNYGKRIGWKNDNYTKNWHGYVETVDGE